VTEGRLQAAAIALSVLGVAVAGYLTYVHYAALEPFCVGGGGGCAIVQASDQAYLAGIPVAVLGLASYVVLLVVSAMRAETARIVAALVAIVGFGFSAYLTYQSVAVIEATCQWCLASAALMTALAVVCTWRLLIAAPG
jgi:uncharacterized membrane protein